MPATKYRPIREVQQNGTVSKAVIRRAVKKLAELKQSHPDQYKKKIQSSSGTPVQLVVRHS
jgi:hypothetical protein